MFKYVVFGLLFASSVVAVPLDRIVAVVNDEVILESELIEMQDSLRQQLRQRNSAVPPENIFRSQVLERLIVQKVQLQKAASGGIRVGDDALNAAIRQIASNNNLSLREFRDVLASDGYDFAQFRETIREEMIIKRLRKSQVEDRVVVSEREVDNFIATAETSDHKQEVEYELQHILVSLPDAAAPEQVQAAQEKLEKIQALLADKGDFSQIAAGYSDAQDALEGGVLGWRKAGELPSLFAGAVPQLEVGQVSPVLRSGSGYHLVRLMDKKSGEVHLVKQTLASHILIKTNEVVTDEQAEKRLNNIRERVLNGEDFADLAKAHSDDTGSAIDGGSLGWVSPGVMVPEFEEKMNELADGEVSEVFKSRFGWHFIKVFEHREENMAEEFQRGKARQQIRQRKISEEMDSWLRAMRDEAYVEYRDF